MPVLYLMLLKQYFKTYLLICINMLALYLDEILYWRENMLNKKVISILLSIFFTMLPSDIVVKSKTYNDKDNSVWQKNEYVLKNLKNLMTIFLKTGSILIQCP